MGFVQLTQPRLQFLGLLVLRLWSKKLGLHEGMRNLQERTLSTAVSSCKLCELCGDAFCST